MPLRRVAPAGVLACALAAPAAAQAAPTLQPLAPCYVSAGEAEAQRQAVSLVAGGFTPNALIDVAVDGQPVSGPAGSQVAGPDGTLAGQRPGALPRARAAPLHRHAHGAGHPANSVTASRGSPRWRSPSAAAAAPTRRVRFRGRGFTGRGPVYAHYVFRGRLRTPCPWAAPTAPAAPSPRAAARSP